MRTLTAQELNRTLLLRQLLLERKRISLVRAVDRLVALQAQYAPSPYVALWSRVAGLRKEALTEALGDGRVVKAGVMRGTLHVVTRGLYPFIESAHIDAQRGRIAGLGTDPAALAAAMPDGAVTAAEARAIAAQVLGTEDRWTIDFTLRATPWVRTAPIGSWPHNKPSPAVIWREPLASPDAGALRVVRAYLAAYGPAAREDVEQYTGFRVRQIEPALEGLRSFADERGRVLYDLPRAPLAGPGVRAPVRFLPAFDSIILAHRDRSRILPDAYYETVLKKKNAMTLATFTVDGLIAGSWSAVERRGRWSVTTESFEPLPARVRREVSAEAERLAAFYNA